MRELLQGIERTTRENGRDTARRVADATRRDVPRVSGDLAESIRSTDSVDGGEVIYGEGLDYAGWIEYGGSRGRESTPEGRYLGPNVQDATDPFQRAMRADAEHVVRRL